MKIDYKEYPVLKVLEDINNNAYFYQEDLKDSLDFIESSTEIFNDHKSSFNNIIVVSKSFREAVEKATPSLGKIYKEVSIKKELDIKGTFIIDQRVFMIDVHQDDNGLLEGVMYEFDKSGNFRSIYISKINLWWSSKLLSLDTTKAIGMGIIILFYIDLFKKYANVETKVVNRFSRIRDKKNIYLNGINLPIIFLDSKWFTTLVRSEGFNVRGHFRLQPKKKDGEWTKELIWIDEFHKTGYTHTAKILSYNE